ncbi:MAG: CDP-glycerol glycerophosphotransferase family protein [Treponema sp.]|nr:CDP-glycerol glycerophosphotransferase family protein [Treponema sp.]
MSFLYIDPGTGSMLFTIFIGAVTTLFFLAKAAWLKLKVFFSGGKDVTADKSYKPYVIYCEDKRYWCVFKTILDEFENRKIDVTYYVADESDPVFNEKYNFVHPEAIGSGNRAFAKLNMLSAGFVLMTTPGIQVYQLKRSKNVKHYSHILHAASDATTYRLFGIDYFDSILCTGDYQHEDVRLLEKKRGLPEKDLVTVGCSYLDVYKTWIEKIPEEENHKFTVLLSPTWGKSGLLALYGEKLLDPLVKTGFHIIIRPHPQSKVSEKDILDSLEEKYKDCSNVEWDTNRDNLQSLKRADIMITDFSGIIWDYTFLRDKPVIYANAEMDLTPYDAYDVDHEIWQFKTIKKIGIKLEEKDFANIKDVILNASDSPELKQARTDARSEGWQYIGECGKRTVDYMVKIVES